MRTHRPGLVARAARTGGPHRWAARATAEGGSCRSGLRARLVLPLLILGLLATWAPLPARAMEPCATLLREPLPFPLPAPSQQVASAVIAGAPGSRVVLDGREFVYSYAVNGQAEIIRGMGYNPIYAGLPVELRRARYERDFGGMAAAGVNTVFGWNPAEFDGLTLDVAAEHGLGVALPYDLDWRLDFGDPAVRAAIRSEVLGWVERYRAHPALRLWAIGNETFHKLVPPSWCSQAPTAEQAEQARALGAFYTDLIDAVHALDPDHPVIYREAEDSYVDWLRAALEPGGRRPWFVYGLNIYTPRLSAVLDAWPARGFDVAVLLSEFAPGPESRPDGYRYYWATIRDHRGGVLGGSVYVWFADGPEAVDRVYGLVDPDGRPLDRSLDVIREIYSE